MKNEQVKSRVIEKFRCFIESNPNGRFDVITTLRSPAIWEKMKEGLSLKQLADEFDLYYPTLASDVNESEFKTIYNSLYTYPKQQMQREVYGAISTFYQDEMSFNDRRTIKPLELDIFFPSKNIAIEFNGDYWHSEAVLDPKEAKKIHIRKTNICKKSGIRLFHIFQHQWETREKQILNFIKSILGSNKINIPARKCTTNNNKCQWFIDKNHIQGSGHAIQYFNLTYNNEIVATMTASRHHRQNASSKDIVLSRLCFADNCNVQGGASRLFSMMKKWSHDQGYERIISWSDNAWTLGNVYKVLGFDLDKEYPPDYFYWDAQAHRVHSKQSQQKKLTGCPEGTTEREWCEHRGLYRIWDCGKRRWIFNLA